MIDHDKYKGHTGPWTRNSRNQIFDADGVGVAEVALFPYSAANSHLIADAPLILARLKEVEEEHMAAMENIARKFEENRRLRREIKRLTKALNKAKGGSK